MDPIRGRGEGPGRWDRLVVDLEQDGEILVVHIGGTLDLATSPALVRRVERACALASVQLPVRAAVLDLGELAFLGCAGVRALRHLAERLMRTGTPCYLRVRPRSHASTIFAVVGRPPELPDPPAGLWTSVPPVPRLLVRTGRAADGARLATVSGDVDLATESAFAALLEELRAGDDVVTTVVDLSGVGHLSAAGGMLLARLRTDLAQRGGTLVVVTDAAGPAGVLHALGVQVLAPGLPAEPAPW